MKILLVEDDDMSRDMLSRRLQRRGHEVVVAEDGASALRLAAEAPPQLVLMDLRMPDPDGWETTRRLKADPRTKDVPVIALTAHTADADRATALQAGCADFDSKPVDIDRLLAKIRALVPGSA